MTSNFKILWQRLFSRTQMQKSEPRLEINEFLQQEQERFNEELKNLSVSQVLAGNYPEVINNWDERLSKAGYPSVHVALRSTEPAIWARQHIGPQRYTFVFGNECVDFWFNSEEDAAFFALRWAC